MDRALARMISRIYNTLQSRTSDVAARSTFIEREMRSDRAKFASC